MGGLGGLRPFQDVPMSAGPQQPASNALGSVSPLFQVGGLRIQIRLYFFFRDPDPFKKNFNPDPRQDIDFEN